jgi:predicted anti-sigma-YlaC factor YlaD
MPVRDELTCQEVVELITDYLENALLPEKQRQVEKHIAECPGCENYLGQVRYTIRLLRQLAQQTPFPTQKEELLRIFRNWQQSSQPPVDDS